MVVLIVHDLTQQLLVDGDVRLSLRQVRVSLGRKHINDVSWRGDASVVLVLGMREGGGAAHLAGKQLQYQVTVALHLRRAGPGLQLEPGVVASDWNLLQEFEEQVGRGNPPVW